MTMNPKETIVAAVVARRIGRHVDAAYRAADAVMRADPEVLIEVCDRFGSYFNERTLLHCLDDLPKITFLIDIAGDPETYDFDIEGGLTASGMRRMLLDMIDKKRSLFALDQALARRNPPR